MNSTLALGAFRIARGAGGEAVREREPRRAGEGRLVWNRNSCVLIDYGLWAAKSEGRQWVDHCINLYVDLASIIASIIASVIASVIASIITLNLGVGCAPSCWPIF